MTKKASKKTSKKKNKSAALVNKPKPKNRGKKQCKRCSYSLPIHTKICTQCGFVHDMKKTKADVMKGLNKITPIIIKSIIENNDFNQFKKWNSQSFICNIGEVEQIQGTGGKITKKKSSSTHHQAPMFNSTNRTMCTYLQSSKLIACMSSTKIKDTNILIYTETITKIAKQLTPNENTTIDLYKLQPFHCSDISYSGQTLINLCKNGSTYAQILVDKHLIAIKAVSNLVAALTGQATLFIFTIPEQENIVMPTMKSRKKSKQSQPQRQILKFSLIDKLQILQILPDKITSFQWLRASGTKDSILIIIGTSFGHISIYEIKLSKPAFEQFSSDQYHLLRYIHKAHYQAITCISECPLNKSEQTLMFATGCYDGSVKIWDAKQKNKIIQCNTTNKKIERLFWDPGAKFLLLQRDQLYDSLILVCFYSINKIQQKVHLADTVEIRTIKKHFPIHSQTPHASIIISQQSYDSKYISLLDTVNGYFRILSLEELRGASLKKKKNRDGTSVHSDFHITFTQKQSVIIEEIQPIQEQQNQVELKNKNNHRNIIAKKFPVFCESIVVEQELQRENRSVHSYYLGTYDGKIIKFEQKGPQKNEES